jgi:uncharacterized membrane protein
MKRSDDHHPSKWIWGMFYYNKDDKRLFPPKKLPFMGWTVNFANPLSILAFVVIILTITLLGTLL